MTLEQQRAADAWRCADGASKAYANLAKGVPALMMNSGLMQTLAFLHQKEGTHYALALHLRQWLRQRFPETFASEDFTQFMEALLGCDSRTFRAVTAEAFAWLRWLRQIAPARSEG